MWDMGDTATLFQDAAGTAPVTAVTQTIGMVLDKSQGLVLGPELVTNGNFSSGGTGWTFGAGISISGGAANYGPSASANLENNAAGFVSGKTYLVTFTVSSLTSGSISPWIRGTYGLAVSSNGTYSRYVVAGSGADLFLLSGVGCTATVDNVSVKLIPGNHATQPTAGWLPLFSARKNQLQKTEVLSAGSWTKQASVTVTDNAVIAPNGSMIGTQVDWTAAAVNSGIFQSGITKPANVPNTKTVYVRADSAGGTVELTDPNNAIGSSLVTLTTSWQPLVLTETTAYTAFGLWVRKTASSPNRIYIAQPQLELGSTSTAYQRVNTASDYDTVGFPAFAQFDATDDALLFPAITFGGAFNTFVAGKVTGGTQGVHLWRTADVNGTWAKYKSGDATTPTGTGSGSPTYAVNGTALSPSQQGQLYTQINGVDCVVESIGVVLTAETALQLSGFVGSLFTGNAHRVLMISGTLTAGEKLLCRRWCAQGNGVTVV